MAGSELRNDGSFCVREIARGEKLIQVPKDAADEYRRYYLDRKTELEVPAGALIFVPNPVGLE